LISGPEQAKWGQWQRLHIQVVGQVVVLVGQVAITVTKVAVAMIQTVAIHTYHTVLELLRHSHAQMSVITVNVAAMVLLD
jgi:hypothetical protein